MPCVGFFLQFTEKTFDIHSSPKVHMVKTHFLLENLLISEVVLSELPIG